MADRMGRVEVRLDCPHCCKRKGDKTLSLNTRKRMVGSKEPVHFATQHVDDLEKERNKRAFRFEKIKETCQPICDDDIATQYLCYRLGERPPKLPRLGFSLATRYYTGLDNYKTTPAMVAALQDATGRTTGWHITHLSIDGRKAFGSDSRRYCKLHHLKGSAVRLYPATDTLIVAEGIETALALHLVSNDPVWACTSASMLKAFEPPPEVKTLLIASDNDKNRVGQKAAWELRHRLRRQVKCEVLIPDKENTDWLDQLRGA
jgi:putative DNA primase/helicase